MLIAGIPFNLTLPVYGAMLVPLVYGSDPALRPMVSALWPFGRPGVRAPETVSLTR